MSQPRRFSRRARWAVPAGVAAIVGLVAGGTLVSAAQAAPALAARRPAHLLTDCRRGAAPAPRPVTATIQESAALGLPDLPDMGSVSSGLSLLSGSHTIKVWYADPVHVRLAEQVPMGETDLRVDGSRVWLWQSSSQTAPHLLLPARSAAPGPLGKSSRPAAGKAAVELTPQQATQRVLAAVGPTTAVSVQQNVTVAGQPAYELRLALKDSGSLIGQIDIDIDAANYLPLQLQVLARGAVTPAFQVGYTALSFGRPAAGNFPFRPAAGGKGKDSSRPRRARRAAPGQALSEGSAGRVVRARRRQELAVRRGRAGECQPRRAGQCGRRRPRDVVVQFLQLQRRLRLQLDICRRKQPGTGSAADAAAGFHPGAWSLGLGPATRSEEPLLGDA